MTRKTRVLVAGIGNEMRHDDGAGPVVARLAMDANETCRDNVVSVCSSTVAEPLELLGLWDNVDLAVVVDAVRSDLPPGTVWLRWLSGDGPETSEATVAGARQMSSHAFGLASVYRLARAMGRGPGRLALIGIEGQDFSHGEGLSGPVEVSVAVAARLIAGLLFLERAGAGSTNTAPAARRS